MAPYTQPTWSERAKAHGEREEKYIAWTALKGASTAVDQQKADIAPWPEFVDVYPMLDTHSEYTIAVIVVCSASLAVTETTYCLKSR
jgi:hypothetical protein